jgi:hypothetical protein
VTKASASVRLFALQSIPQGEIGGIGNARHVGLLTLHGDANAKVIVVTAQIGGVGQHRVYYQRPAGIII